MSQYDGYKLVFCDGSKSINVAAADWCEEFCLKARLPELSSIFSAELYAIYCVIKFIKHRNSKYLILSDPLNALEAIANPYQQSHYLVIKFVGSYLIALISFWSGSLVT